MLKTIRKIMRNTYKLTLTSLGIFAILAMIAGFVPQMKSQWRGAISHKTYHAEIKPATRPLSHISWQVRQELHPTTTGQILPLKATENPIKKIEVTSAPYPVLSLLLPSNNILPSNDPLDFTGTPLRWQTLSCTPSPEAISSKAQALWQLKYLTQPSDSVQARAKNYEKLVLRFAKKYKLTPELIYAIIYTESSFNPNSISSSMAHGLMQIVPTTAGGEVHKWLGKTGIPTSTELLNPENNIRYGTTYLHILLTSHLKAITDPLSREYCAIAAYNQGTTAMLKTFAPTQAEAFQIINHLTPTQVHTALLSKLTSKQAIAFLNKVLSTKARFLALQ